MFLEQICPGQLNSSLHAIHTFIWEDDRLIIYASGDKVVIYADPNKPIQVLTYPTGLKDDTNPLAESVAAVAGNSSTGQIAVAYGSVIGIYGYSKTATDTDNPHQWTLDHLLDASNRVSCLDWSFDGTLVAAGVGISLWRLNPQDTTAIPWQKIWSSSSAAEIIMAKFDHSSPMFATIAQYDRLVTVWYRSKTTNANQIHYDFVFLSHPRHVTHFVWRKLPQNSHDCTLFTMARDGIGRFWSPVDLEQMHKLYLCAVIDPCQSLVTAEPASEDGSIAHIDHGEDFSPIHYIGCDELSSSLFRDFQHHSKHERLDHSLDRMRNMVRDTPDLLFRLQSDGSLIFWGVQHLNCSPRRVPRVFVVLRIAQAIDASDITYFLNPVHVLHDYSHIQSSSIVKPVELSLLAINPHGQLRCYGLNLLDFLDSTSFIPRLHLKYNWLGHQHAIRSLQQAQNNRFSTVGVDGQINIWKYALHEVSGKSGAQLQLNSSIHVNSNNLLSVTLDDDAHVVVYNGMDMLLYTFDHHDCHLQHSYLCDKYDASIPLSSLHIHRYAGNSSSPQDSPKVYLLVAVSDSHKTAFLWQIMLDDVSDRRREPHIEFCGQQVFEWSDIPSAVSTIDWSPTNTASMILRQLCTKDGQLPILTVAVGSSIFFYGVDQPDDEYATVSLKELYTLETGIRGTIYQIRGVSNLLALASLSSDGSKHELSFWAEMRTMEPPALFTSVIFEDRIRDMAWSMSSDAQFLLAVAFSSHIAIYGENRRSDINHDEPTWTCYTIFEVDSPADIVGVTWADYGVLAVAAGNQIRCYLKWLTVNDNIKGSLRLNPEAEPMSNIYDLSYEKNGPLPLYHPYHLIHYLMWGKMELITHVLYSLYKFVRQTIDEENVTEQVPPLSVSAILKLQNAKVQSQQQPHQDSSALFDDDDTRLDLDDLGHDSPRALTSSESTFLMKHLKQKRLAGLSEREQMHLVAMIDTFVEITAHNEALDENGARFTALVENHFHLNQILPADQRQPDLTSRDIVWALHSQSQDMLLERCMKLGGKNLMWPDARSLGLVLWLQKIDVVRDLIATIARNTYLAKEELKDPVDCTLFYLALRKKNLLQGLWRTASHHKEQSVMLKFLANDFSEPRWQKAAVKNAFVLLGRQRFEYAASFFLLADRLRDAVNVILKHMKDSQLAIAICRVYEGDHSPLLKDILQNTVLSDAIAANDRWMVSAAFWMLNRPSDAVRAIVLPLSQFDESVDTHDQASVATITDPNLFILYQHMKIHVQHRNHVTVDIPYDVEYMFYLQVSRAYERLGCPLLALYILDHFYMKPPLAVKASPPITEEKPSRAADLSADENDEPSRAANKKPARAVDLFADEDPKPARAADLFADDDVKPARAADLFGDSDDDSNNLFSRSRSTGPVDLFADLETTTPIPTYDDDDLFADSDLGSQAASSASDEAPMEKTKDGLSSYKALLLMRMLQTVFHAAATLYHTIPMAEIHQEPKFQDAFLTDRQDLIELGETLAIDRTMFSRLLMEKTIEVDVFPFYMNILDQHVLDGGDVGYFLQAFKTSYFQICEPVLMQRELTYPALRFFERWTDDVLATFHIWSRLMTQHDTSPKTALIVNNIVLSSYVCSIVTTLQQRHYEKSWKLLYHLRELIEAVLGGANKQHEMVRLFTKLQTQETPMVEMNAEDFDAFSDDSMFGFDLNEEIYKPLVDARDKSSGAYIMEAASLNHTLSLLESCMKTSAKATGINNELVEYIWTSLLDPLATRVHFIKSLLTEQLDNDLSQRHVLKQLKTLRQKKYWHSLLSLNSIDHLLPFIRRMIPEFNLVENDPDLQCETVYHSTTTVHAFSMSPMASDTLAVVLKNEIQEIDLNKVQRYGAPLVRALSISSLSPSQDTHPDSYPDSEEDDGDAMSSDTEIETGMKKYARRRGGTAKHSSTSTPTSGLPPSATRSHPDEPSKPSQNLGLDHLQDTLKRSLGMGSDHARSPIGTSPGGSSMDSGDRERMILLRRPIVATCAETHPQFPFYITGGDPSTGGASAMLWQFGQEREIATYYGCQDKTTKIHFDRFGQKFGAADMHGNLCLWRFDSHAHSDKPYCTLSCHSKATRDFAFLGSSSVIATAGTSTTMSRRRDNVCIWDTLLPPHKAMVCALPAHESGAYAIAYDPNRHLLFSGGKRGDIVVSDIRQRSTMHTFTAHHARIRSIAVDLSNQAVISGSIDGELKIWDASTYRLRQTFDIQPRNRFLTSSFKHIPLKAFGVTQVQMMDDGYVYTSGPAGVLRCRSSMHDHL